MPRKYEKVQKLLPEVQRLNAEGYTHRQIAEKLGQCQAERGQVAALALDRHGGGR